MLATIRSALDAMRAFFSTSILLAQTLTGFCSNCPPRGELENLLSEVSIS